MIQGLKAQKPSRPQVTKRIRRLRKKSQIATNFIDEVSYYLNTKLTPGGEMMNLKKNLTASVMTFALLASSAALAGKPVGITKDMMFVETNHLGKTVKIQRNQDN